MVIFWNIIFTLAAIFLERTLRKRTLRIISFVLIGASLFLVNFIYFGIGHYLENDFKNGAGKYFSKSEIKKLNKKVEGLSFSAIDYYFKIKSVEESRKKIHFEVIREFKKDWQECVSTSYYDYITRQQACSSISSSFSEVGFFEDAIYILDHSCVNHKVSISCDRLTRIYIDHYNDRVLALKYAKIGCSYPWMNIRSMYVRGETCLQAGLYSEIIEEKIKYFDIACNERGPSVSACGILMRYYRESNNAVEANRYFYKLCKIERACSCENLDLNCAKDYEQNFDQLKGI